MCWVGVFRLQEAQKDIEVYKVVIKDNKCYRSAYRNFPYIKGQTYHSKIISGRRSILCSVYTAIHSYSKELTEVNFNEKPGYRELVISNKITYRRIDYFTNSENFPEFVIMPCIIPIGAKYCINNRGEIISDTLKIL